jgi:hypothetical protein
VINKIFVSGLILFAPFSEAVDLGDGKAPAKRIAIPVEVKAPASSILQECRIAQGSRYLGTLQELNSKSKDPDGACDQADTCTGRRSAPDRAEATRLFLYELRKIREAELYQIEAMNALLYDPDHFKMENPGLESELANHLCERSNTALRQEISEALRQGSLAVPQGSNPKALTESILSRANDCGNPDSPVTRMIASAAGRAIDDFKKRELKRPVSADLARLNRDFAALRKGCEKVTPNMIPVTREQKSDAKNTIEAGIRKYQEEQKSAKDYSGWDPALVAQDRKNQQHLANQLRAVVPQTSEPVRAGLTKKEREAQEKQRLAVYKSEVFPVVQRIFSSPYGRLLADSTYLQDKMGLDLNADWNGPGFCTLALNGRPLSQTEINTGYFGSPSLKVKGIKAITRENIGNLAMTRIPELRDHFWKPFSKASTLQSREAEAQQQVAYELLYHSSHPGVKALIQNNPMYAQLACEAIEHEAFWERKDVARRMQWAKNIATYGGIGVGLAGGFFSGGTGWVMAASLAGGLGLGAAGQGLEMKENLENRKTQTLQEIQGLQNALADQAGTRESSDDANAMESRSKIEKLKPADRSRVEAYADKFSAVLAERNLRDGKVISGTKSPTALLNELLKSAQDEHEKYLIQLAYNAAITAVSVGAGRGLEALKDLAQARNLTRLEKIAEIGVRLEAGHVSPTDIADAIGSCLVLKDCSGAGALMGAGMKAGTTSLSRLFSAVRGLRGNQGKSDEELLRDIAEQISRQSGGKASTADVLAQLKTSLKEQDFRNVADAPSYRESYVRDQVETYFKKPDEKWAMDAFLQGANPKQKLALQGALEELDHAGNLSATEREQWLKKIHERISGCKVSAAR